ncbi:universal stress protein [Dysgonomonas sp. 520]|uniref:universal stress protein n=1 Tax=Dysgonomonas sp. 520 TaxID=2302931 RepID=UPI0016234B2C|nr:universal stress protein [Dysgonomonas sp. 520]
MDNNLLTLAIHTQAKANILKSILEGEGIKVYMERVESLPPDEPGTTNNFYIKVSSTDLTKALSIIEVNKLFSYSDQDTYKIDDGNQRILVAVDFSDYSIKACQIAFDIAKIINAKIKILHIYNNIYFPSHIPFADTIKTPTENEGMLGKIRKHMLELCLDIDKKISAGEWPSVNYSYSIREGIVEEEIENFVLEYKPSLLVLGKKGINNNKNSVLGNVTADVIEMTDVPVLAVPEHAKVKNIFNIKHIAFLTNFQKRDLLSFDKIVNLLGSYPNIRVTLIHINRINRKGDKWREYDLIGMKELFLKQYPQLNIDYKLIDSPDIPEAVINFIEEEDVSAVCINTRRRNIFGRIFAPSFSRKFLENSNSVPLFVLRG